jgi:hypothetical protein
LFRCLFVIQWNFCLDLCSSIQILAAHLSYTKTLLGFILNLWWLWRELSPSWLAFSSTLMNLFTPSPRLLVAIWLEPLSLNSPFSQHSPQISAFLPLRSLSLGGLPQSPGGNCPDRMNQVVLGLLSTSHRVANSFWTMTLSRSFSWCFQLWQM